jgi:hypothetical protein
LGGLAIRFANRKINTRGTGDQQKHQLKPKEKNKWRVQMSKEDLPSETMVSLWSGIFLPVVYKGHHIVAHNSSWTSRMTIWVDGEVVFSQSSWKFICEQDIAVGAQTLSTRFGLAKRGFIFEVFDGGQQVASAHYSTRSLGWKQVVPLIVLGMALGFSVEYFDVF